MAPEIEVKSVGRPDLEDTLARMLIGDNPDQRLSNASSHRIAFEIGERSCREHGLAISARHMKVNEENTTTAMAREQRVVLGVKQFRSSTRRV